MGNGEMGRSDRMGEGGTIYWACTCSIITGGHVNRCMDVSSGREWTWGGWE